MIGNGTVFRAVLLAATGFLALVAGAGAPLAQVYYNGWNIGPDYGSMMNQLQQREQMMALEMQKQSALLVQQAMANPDCAAKFRRYLSYGGRMDYPTFAYYYVATGAFSPEGIAYFNKTEIRNNAAEMAALMRLREAEQQSGQALNQWQNGFSANQWEGGNLLMGNSTYLNPQTGTSHVLQHMQPGVPTTDPNTGQTYQMDNLGNYSVLMPNGYWYPMVPRR